MKATVEVSIECRDRRTAEKLLAVLEPDNREFPKGQAFSSELSGRRLVLRLRSRDRFMSLVSTLEGMLSDAQLFQEVWLLSS